MSQFAQILSVLREQINTNVSRSDVLKPLAWLVGLLIVGAVSSSFSSQQAWLPVVFAAAFVAAMLVYGFAYVFCLMNDRDALRSERYSLQKMAIEHGVMGDSVSGVVEAAGGRSKLLESSRRVLADAEAGEDA